MGKILGVHEQFRAANEKYVALKTSMTYNVRQLLLFCQKFRQLLFKSLTTSIWPCTKKRYFKYFWVEVMMFIVCKWQIEVCKIV